MEKLNVTKEQLMAMSESEVNALINRYQSLDRLNEYIGKLKALFFFISAWGGIGNYSSKCL